MKQYKILAFFFAFALIITSCEDTFENRVASRGVAAVPGLSNVNPAFYTTDFSESFIEFTVSLEDGVNFDAAELQVTFKENTVVIQDIPSFPMTITMPVSEALAVLGLEESDVEVDDFFIFQVVTTHEGISSPSRSGSLRVNVTCEFDPLLTEGSYHVVSNDWEVEGTVELIADADNPYLIGIHGLYEMEGGEPNDKVLYLNINPSDFSVTGEKTILGPTEPWGDMYVDYSYTPISGLYRSCTGAFEMVFDINISIGGWGPQNFIFTKN